MLPRLSFDDIMQCWVELGAHATNRPAQHQPPAGGDTDMLIARVCLSKPHSLDPLRSTFDLALLQNKARFAPKLDNFGTVRMTCRILVSRSSRGLQRIAVQVACLAPQACKGCEVVTRHPESRSYARRMTLAWSRQLFTACSAPPLEECSPSGACSGSVLNPKRALERTISCCNTRHTGSGSQRKNASLCPKNDMILVTSLARKCLV